MISVVIPAYNAQDFIGRTLKSLIAQTLADIEIIVVNDGSTDDTENIVHQMMQKDDRIRLFTIPNGGAFAARLFGVRKARGEWITFSDSDDTLPQHALESLYHFATDDRDIVVGNLNLNNKRLFNHAITGDITGRAYIESILLGKTSIGNIGKLYRHRLFEGLHLVPPRLRINEDMLMLLSVAVKASGIFVTNDIVVYDYLFRSESISKSCSMELSEWLELFSFINSTLSGHFTPEIADAFSIMKIRRLYDNVIMYGSFFDPDDNKVRLHLKDCERVASLSSRDAFKLSVIKSISLQKTTFLFHRLKLRAKSIVKKCLCINR